MSWSQDYSVPSVIELLVKLTGKNIEELLKQELEKQGITIVKQEDIVVTEGMYDDIHGTKVTLSDGRVFVPKLVESRTADGNWGCDTYEYVLEDENPKVDYINDDDTEQPLIGGCGDEGCGCGF